MTPAAPQLIMPLAYHSVLSQGITISAVYFDDRKFQLTVADQADGCGSQWLDAKSAALSCDGYAAINGGFFTPEGKPLGTPRSIRNQTRLLEPTPHLVPVSLSPQKTKAPSFAANTMRPQA